MNSSRYIEKYVDNARKTERKTVFASNFFRCNKTSEVIVMVSQRNGMGYCLALLIAIIMFLGITSPAMAVMESYFSSDKHLMLPNYPPIEDTRLELFIGDSNLLYVFNVTSKMVYKMKLDGEMMGEFHLDLPEDILATQASIWVRKGHIYLKYPDEFVVWRFAPDGRLQRKIDLKYPNELATLNGLVVDPRGYFYLIDSSKASVEVFNSNGAYVGCFKKMGERLGDLRGIPQYIYMDGEGNLHVTVRLSGNDSGEIQKYNYQGELEQRFSDIPRFYSKITVDEIGNVYAIEPSNLSVIKFDRRGRMICRFKTRQIQSLAVDHWGQIYLENAQSGLVEVLKPSEMVRWIDRGNRAFLDDDWETAESHYRQALRLNNQLDFVHIALGEIYYQQRRYVESMRKFKLVEDRWRYSQALYGFRWHIINNYWHYMAVIFLITLCLLVKYSMKIQRFIQKHLSFLSMIWAPQKTLQQEIHNPRMIRTFGIIIGFAIMSYLSWYGTNPIFVGEKQVFSQQLFALRLSVISLLVILWAWTGYKVGELFQGMAKNIRVFLYGTALCLFPAIVFLPVLAMASHALTFDEFWIHLWAGRLLIIWTVILFILKIRLTEDFSWGKALGIGLLNVGATVMVLCFFGFLIGINQQIYGFLNDIYREVYTRFGFLL